MHRNKLKQLVTAAMLLGLGYILPFLTGQVSQFGRMLLPMHLPVFLCGLICGWRYGLAVGLVLPLTRSLMFGMPAFYPTALAMTFELATYGFTVGILFSRARWKCLISLYRCLILAMLAGRVVSGVANAVLLEFGGNGFTLGAFLTVAFVEAIPGILLQLILIPFIMLALDRTHLVPFHNAHGEMNRKVRTERRL